MGRRAITRELYDRIVEGYRQAPGNATYAARYSGVDRRTAGKAWAKGWPAFTWAIPIREVIRQEMESARAERIRLQEEERAHQQRERDRARQDAVKTQAEELQATAAARQSAIVFSGLTRSLMVAMVPLAQTLKQNLETRWQDLTPQQVTKVFSDAAYIVKASNESVKLALEVERLRNNEPTSILGVQGHLEEVTTEEAVEELLAVERTLRRAVKTLPQELQQDLDGDIIIDLPDEAWEEQEAEVIDLNQATKQKKRSAL